VAWATLQRTFGACVAGNRHNIGGTIHAHGHWRTLGVFSAGLLRARLPGLFDGASTIRAIPFPGPKSRQIDSYGRSPEKEAPGLSSSICTSPIARSRNPPSQ
jgi:hypothetical protein